MDRIELTNETDETIEIQPGESLRIWGEKSHYRSMAKRITTFIILEIRKR